ncbi:hypothetical protein M3M33_14265, partial [Loigolactobacillus coryniformis]|uniref:hypothetical protein n=1 Tax=Loigolactobacillus coryniformis TaxID=1610 RepID=UPI00201B14F5
PLFVRNTLPTGGFIEEAGCDYNFKERNWLGHDSEFCVTYRPVPNECIIKDFFIPKVGKTIIIEGRISGVCRATIIAFDNLYLQTDFVPQY